MPSNDIKLHCREATPTIPIVFIHGNGESSEYFSGQIEYFSSRRTVLAPDMRGHGDTPRGDAPFTLFQFAEDLKCACLCDRWTYHACGSDADCLWIESCGT